MARFGVLFTAFAALAACASKPDLAITGISLSTGAVAPGAPVTVRSAVTNIGDEPVADDFGAPVAASVAIGVFTGQDAPAAVADLSAWSLPGDHPMQPGEERREEQTMLAPSSLAAGPYFVCAEADRENLVAERSERNNRDCAPLTVLASPLTRADLIVEAVKTLGQELASAKVSIRVKNVGEADAGVFPVMAFTRWPRRPVMLTACPLTQAERDAGSTPACGGLWTRAKLPPGGAVEWIGYLTFGFGGSTMPVTPVGPQKPEPVKEMVDFMADGCFAPADQEPLPRWCRVDEIDEINNFAAKEIRMK